MEYDQNKEIKMKILILGHGRHGKDTLAGILQKHLGLTFAVKHATAEEIQSLSTTKEVK